MKKVSVDLADLRREYRMQPLQRSDLNTDPLLQFNRWFEEAGHAESMDANAMSIATVASDGQPTVRTVLLKYYDQDGFVFYTNLKSDKAKDLDDNPRASLLFYWSEMHRQVIINGSATRISAAENIKYFMRRPRDSQLGAWVSQQSQVISSRSVLEQKFNEVKQKFARGEVPLPSFWGGYRVCPASIEFWQGRESRLHDRFRYFRANEDSWNIERLAP